MRLPRRWHPCSRVLLPFAVKPSLARRASSTSRRPGPRTPGPPPRRGVAVSCPRASRGRRPSGGGDSAVGHHGGPGDPRRVTRDRGLDDVPGVAAPVRVVAQLGVGAAAPGPAGPHGVRLGQPLVSMGCRVHERRQLHGRRERHLRFHGPAASVMRWRTPAGQPWLTPAALCGAVLGFLPWNFPRARVFLGDVGSSPRRSDAWLWSARRPRSLIAAVAPACVFLTDTSLTLTARGPGGIGDVRASRARVPAAHRRRLLAPAVGRYRLGVHGRSDRPWVHRRHGAAARGGALRRRKPGRAGALPCVPGSHPALPAAEEGHPRAGVLTTAAPPGERRTPACSISCRIQGRVDAATSDQQTNTSTIGIT